MIAFCIIQDLVKMLLLLKRSWTTSYWWVLGLVKWALILSTFFVPPNVELPRHYSMDCLKVTLVWVAFHKVWCSWSFPSKIDNFWFHLLLGTSLDLKRKDVPPPPTTHVVFIIITNLLISLGFSLFFYLFGLKDVDLNFKVFIFLVRFLDF